MSGSEEGMSGGQCEQDKGPLGLDSQFYTLTKALIEWFENDHLCHFRCGLETLDEPDSFCWLNGTDEGCQVMKYCEDKLVSLNFIRIFCEQISGVVNEPSYSCAPVTAYARLVNFEYTYLFIYGSDRILYRDDYYPEDRWTLGVYWM